MALLITDLAPRSPACDQRSAAPGALLRLIEIVEVWSERWHQRRALRDLSDHARQDIALSAADIEAEAAKPFWQP